MVVEGTAELRPARKNSLYYVLLTAEQELRHNEPIRVYVIRANLETLENPSAPPSRPDTWRVRTCGHTAVRRAQVSPLLSPSELFQNCFRALSLLLLGSHLVN